MFSFLSSIGLRDLATFINGYVIISGVALVYWLSLFYYRSDTYKLRHIPTVGYTSPFLYYLNVGRFMFDAPAAVAEGINNWPGRMFKLATLSRWIIVSSDPKTTEEIYRAPDRIMHSKPALEEPLEIQYTFGKNIAKETFDVAIVKTNLTRSLPRLVPEVHDELLSAFHDYIPETDDWLALPANETFLKVIARASNRVFLGLPLCRDPEFIDLGVRFTIDVVKQAHMLALLHPWLKPIVNYLTSRPRRRVQEGLNFIVPAIADRREDLKKVEKGEPATYDDFLTWLIKEAPAGEEQTDWSLTTRILGLNFTAIHTSSMTFLHALYYVASNPEHVKLLRQEVEEISRREGWSKAALDQMEIVDSVLKESQRLRPLGNVMLRRLLVQDHTFSDGTTVPAGAVVAAAIAEAHMDADAFDDPYTFDPLRYVKLREKDPSRTRQFSMVSTGSTSLAFGHGKHACPGRYFASCELKLMLAHIVLHYDIKLEDEGVRPDDVWFAEGCIPNPTAKVLFRKRQKV